MTATAYQVDDIVRIPSLKGKHCWWVRIKLMSPDNRFALVSGQHDKGKLLEYTPMFGRDRWVGISEISGRKARRKA